MLKNTQRVRNVAHNVIEKVLHDFDFEIEIKFKIYNDGVKFIVFSFSKLLARLKVLYRIFSRQIINRIMNSV